MIDNLPLLTPDSSRNARTIARCQDRLVARRRKIEARKRAPNLGALGGERLLAAGFCFVYLLAMANDLLTLAAQL